MLVEAAPGPELTFLGHSRFVILRQGAVPLPSQPATLAARVDRTPRPGRWPEGESSMFLGVNGIRLVTIRSGVARYIENMLSCWGQIEHPFDEIRVYTPKPLSEAGVSAPLTRNVVVRGRGPYALWEQFHLPRAHGRSDVLFCPSYVAPLAARCPVVVVHHGSYERYSEAFGRLQRARGDYINRWSARRADLLITVSESSKRDMIEFYGLPADRIHVIPVGVDLELFRPGENPLELQEFRQRVLGEDAPFILYVGKPIRRHNIAQMLQAYGRLVHRGTTKHRFLFIGAGLPGIDVAPLVADLGLGEHVTLVAHFEPETVALAMQASSMLIYPSSYEGFGMPVLEAMACGVPAIALDNTAFPEFAGGVAYLAPDAEVDTLAQAMGEVLHDRALRRQMRRDGPVRARDYDWRGLAQRTMDLIAGLI